MATVHDLERKSAAGDQKRAPSGAKTPATSAGARPASRRSLDRIEVERRIARLAARQFGVISLGQLADCGMGYAAVRRRVCRGVLHPLHRGVFAVGHTRVVDHGRLVAALLAAGPSAFLSHRTAAGVWGLRALSVRSIELTVPAARIRPQKPLVVHRTRTVLDPADVATRNGLRVSSVHRLLIELAPREHPAELRRLVTQAVRRRVLAFDELEHAFERHARRPGVKALKAATRAYRPAPERKSGFEVAFDGWLEQHPDIPPPLRNVHIGPWEVDCYWPDHQLAVELDGRAYHIAAGDFEKDRVKDADLQLDGIRVIRITEQRFEHDRAAIARSLRTLMRLAA